MDEEKLEIRDYGADAWPAKITCEHCGTAGQILRFRSIDISKHPEWKWLLLNGDFFCWICPNCGALVEVGYPCRYFDPEEKLAVAMNPQLSENSFSTINEALRGNGTPGFLHRIVENFYAMQEMILIRAAGLDDRVVHLLKPLIIGQLQSMGLEIWNGFFSHVQLPGEEDSGEPQQNMVYLAEEDYSDSVYSEPVLWFNIHFTDGEVAQHGINQTGYRICARRLLQDEPPRDDGLYHLYNLEWAIDCHRRSRERRADDAEAED